MGTFDSHVDAPDQIRQEGEDIVIAFERTGSTTGSVTWNIPSPAHGCNADNQAYSGIVVVLNTVANKVENRPVDGTVFSGDPTADADLHVGDSINGALVIGAFYDDKTTVKLDLTGLIPDTAYFITGHAVDNVHRYHQQGVSTYALPYLYTEPVADTCGYQEVCYVGTKALTDGTGLGSGNFTLDLQIDTIDFDITISGTDAQTFGDLVTALNKAIELLENPFQSTTAPNTGAYWYDATVGKLFQWDGDSHVEISVINELTDPTDVIAGEYWLDTDTNNLFKRNPGNTAWLTQETIDVGYDPGNPLCDVFWAQLSGSPGTVSQMWKWDGSVWCERTTFVQAKDPSCAPDLDCSTYWFDDASEMLFAWDEDSQTFIQTEAIAWDVDPQLPAIGTFWFNDITNELFQRLGPGGSPRWNPLDVTVSETAPTLPNDGDYWFVPSLQELFTFTATGSPEWTSTEVLIWGEDPTDTGSCDLWWNTSTSPQVLNVWDEFNSAWTPVGSFFIGGVNPSLAQVIPTQAIWVQIAGTGSPSTSNIYWEWDGSQFVQITSTNVAREFNDPTTIAIGDVWFDNVNNRFYERIANSGSPTFLQLDVISSADDPTMLSIGTFWYDQTNNELFMWNGVTFVTVLFSTTALTPAEGTLWFNTTTDALLEWSTTSSAWVASTPLAVTTFNDAKGTSPSANIIITTSLCGSSGNILIGSKTITENLTTFVITSFVFTGTLFPAITGSTLKTNIAGFDGLTGVPSYDTLGVGTDGSADERRELADSIRKQLGYPVVEVELTKYEIDQGIQKALESLRQRSASAYRRVYFFLDAKIGFQNYRLTNERVGFNKIVNVMGVWRITSAFLSTVHAAGVFGQTILQHLYHMGTYDLVSYHLISDYIEQLEQLFATRIVYTFDEGSRELFMFQRFTRDERVLLDCVIERTEQELLVNRWTKPWIERWALAECRTMLAEIRGKYASLPGAGGGVALNASDLVSKAQEDFAICLQDIDDFVVNDVENLGIGSEFIIG